MRVSLPEYLRYLSLQLRLHALLKNALPTWVPRAWRELRLVKSSWLRSDLQVLGIASPVIGASVNIGSEAQAMGILYVLEGATLGLQVVGKRMQVDHPARADAFRFMTGYGSDTGSNWRRRAPALCCTPRGTWGTGSRSATCRPAADH